MTQTLGTSESASDTRGEEHHPRRRSIRLGERVRLGILLLATAVLYLRNITVNGMGNQYYAASAQAGSRDWEALLFGSLDSNDFITVDKPPLSQWVMGLSGQVFGFGSASMLVPQALMAVAAVALTYGAVRRISGPWAGLLAGATLASTPVAALMFRFNDPDAVMVLLMTAAAYCTVCALESGSGRWLAGAGVALGFAFLAKMLEGVMVMPVFAAVHLFAAPIQLRARVVHLLGAAAAFVVSAGWFVALTMVWPASSRPYLAGSTDNTFMNLVFGYNGLARVLGRDHAVIDLPSGFDPTVTHVASGVPVGIARSGGFGSFGSRSKGLWSRLLSGEFGYEIGWLVPAALLATVVVVVSRGRAPRTDRVRAGALLFGGWLLLVGLVLSYMHGTIHPYYTLSIAPPVAAVFAIGVQQMWSRRDVLVGRIALAVTLLAAGVVGMAVAGQRCTFGVGTEVVHPGGHDAGVARPAVAVGTAAARRPDSGRGAARGAGGSDRLHPGDRRLGARGHRTVGRTDPDAVLGRSSRRQRETRRPARGDGHPVVSRHRPVVVGGWPRIVNGHCGDGHRWFLGHRSGAHPAAVPGLRRQAPGRVLPGSQGLCPRRRRKRHPARALRHSAVGARQLPLDDGRWHHGVQPVRPQAVT